ncbi:MAG: DUF2269 family protein [Caldilineaceae bacterium]|nr:DUF2269 family protein [Caldilineaceae bacterium]
MDTLYTLFKFLHIAAVIVWLGGVATLSLVHLWLLAGPDRRDLLPALRLGLFLGRGVIAPAALLTLIAGTVMIANAGIPFSTLWIAWGLGGIVVSIAFGATFIRRATERLEQAVAADAPAIAPLQRRLVTYSFVNLALLLSVVWAMVAKPML